MEKLKTGDRVLVEAIVAGELVPSFNRRQARGPYSLLALDLGGDLELVAGQVVAPSARVVLADSMLPRARVAHVSSEALLNWQPIAGGTYVNRFIANPDADGAIMTALAPWFTALLADPENAMLGLEAAQQALIDFTAAAVAEKVERLREELRAKQGA